MHIPEVSIALAACGLLGLQCEVHSTESDVLGLTGPTS